jgi:hypothetical protein
LIHEIVVDVDADAGEVILILHWNAHPARLNQPGESWLRNRARQLRTLAGL